MAALKSGRYVFNPTSIEEVRKRLGLTQQELANRLGIAKTAISRWEQGKVTPDAESLAAIYSVAKENRLEPVFFKERESYMRKGRSRLIVSWDFQNFAWIFINVTQEAERIKEQLTKKFPLINNTLFKVFASSFHSYAADAFNKQGWRLQVFDRDIDEELDSQAWSDCNQAPNDTIFVLITRDGDFVDLIEELRGRGVRVYLMAPGNANQRLIETVGKKNLIPFPAI